MTDDAEITPDDETDAPAKPARGAPSSSMRRVVPSPWVDCANCGWRHYPDSSRKAGPQIPAACANCGKALTPII